MYGHKIYSLIPVGRTVTGSSMNWPGSITDRNLRFLLLKQRKLSLEGKGRCLKQISYHLTSTQVLRSHVNTRSMRKSIIVEVSNDPFLCCSEIYIGLKSHSLCAVRSTVFITTNIFVESRF